MKLLSRTSATLAIALSMVAFSTSAAFGSVDAPEEDGTNGAYDVPTEITVVGPDAGDGLISPFAVTVCEPNATTYAASSVTKSGKVTNWGVHIKNDATSETVTISTTSTAQIGASVSVSGSLTASSSIKKIAEVGLGITTNFGLNGSYAVTTGRSQAVNFNKKGKWVIWAGVYTAQGSVTMKKCNSNGTALSSVGSGSAKTYDKGRVTGLTNCANSVSSAIEADAKSKCG